MNSPKQFVVFDPVTGQIKAGGIGIPPEGEFIIFGWGQEPTHYVDLVSKKIIEKPAQPAYGYSWNYQTKAWELDPAILDRMCRMQRNELLMQSDWTQLPDVPSETRGKWIIYRQKLRDITEQEDYPLNIEWPIQPI